MGLAGVYGMVVNWIYVVRPNPAAGINVEVAPTIYWCKDFAENPASMI
jgi:hypothetical protein